MKQAILELRDVSFGYRIRKGVWSRDFAAVLQNIDLKVYEGETLGILGLNGAGKSTLLRLLAGIYQPSSGKIISSVPKSSLITLGLGFDPVLSGRDNAIFGAMLLGFSKSDAVRSLEEIRDFSELGTKFYDPVRSYSSGMVARLAFSIAVSLEADLLLIDEVLAVGDMLFANKAKEKLLSRINGGQSTVLVSHNIYEVAAACERSVVLGRGGILFDGASSDAIKVYLNPESVEVQNH